MSGRAFSLLRGVPCPSVLTNLEWLGVHLTSRSARQLRLACYTYYGRSLRFASSSMHQALLLASGIERAAIVPSWRVVQFEAYVPVIVQGSPAQ